MASSESRKGRRLEVMLVEWLDNFGVKAERCWGSDGRSRGLHNKVDVIAFFEGYDVYLQCKNDESNPNYLFVDETSVLHDQSDPELYVILTMDKMSEVMSSWVNNKQFALQTEGSVSRARVLADAKPDVRVGIHFQCIKKNHKPMMFVVALSEYNKINILNE